MRAHNLLQLLVIDDRDSVASALCAMWTHLAYSVMRAADARSALSLCASQQLDWVMIDRGAPGASDGRLMATPLRRAGYCGPILLYHAALAEAANLASALMDGASIYARSDGTTLILWGQDVLPGESGPLTGVWRYHDLFIILTSKPEQCMIVTSAQDEIPLSPNDVAILSALLEKPNKPVSQQAIADRGWPNLIIENTSNNPVVSAVRHLRQKLNMTGGSSGGSLIRSHPGAFSIEAPDLASPSWW